MGFFDDIKIITTRNGSGAVTGYREDLAPNDIISAALTSYRGITSVDWYIVGRPAFSSAGGSGPEPIYLTTAQSASFTIDNDGGSVRRDGTYILLARINAGAPNETEVTVALARVSGLTIPTPSGFMNLRKMGGFESMEDTSIPTIEQGWKTQLDGWLELVRQLALGGSSTTTLAQAYAHGTVSGDQTLPLADALGGGVVVDGSSGSFTGTTAFRVNTAAGGPLAVDRATGRVGIGTASPAKPVHIANTAPAVRLDRTGGAALDIANVADDLQFLNGALVLAKLKPTGGLQADLGIGVGTVPATAPVVAIGPGSTAPVSAANTMRFRYNETTGHAEWSENGGAYQPFAAALSAYAIAQNNGSSLTQRATLNFAAPLTAADNVGALRTDVSLSTNSTLVVATGALGRAAITGDVGIPAGSNVATIQPNVVDNTKIRQSAANSIIGNPTGATANVQDITLGAGLTFTGTTLVNSSPLSGLTATAPLTMISGTNIGIRGAVTTGGTSTAATSLGALASGVLQIAVSAGIAAPSTFVSTLNRVPFGSGVNGGLTDSASLVFTGSSLQVLNAFNGTGGILLSNTSNGTGAESLIRFNNDASPTFHALIEYFSSTTAVFGAIPNGLSISNTGGGVIVTDGIKGVAFGTAAKATTDSGGYMQLQTVPGVPNGTQTPITGQAPVTVDSTDDRLYVYNGGWKPYGQFTGALSTGLLKSTTTTGVWTIAVAGTDYQVAGAYITALTGDVTATGPGSAVATIGANKVTYAKIQQVSGSRLLGNAAATTGNVGEITIGSGLSLSTGGVLSAGAATLFYQTVAGAGVPLTQRPALNFDAFFTVTDNAGANRTDVSLANNAVTFSKIQTVAANSILMNPTAATAAAQAVTLGTSSGVVQYVNSTTDSFVIYPAGANRVPFGSGISGQLTDSVNLTFNGTTLAIASGAPAAIALTRSGDQYIEKQGTSNLWVGTIGSQLLGFYTANTNRMSFSGSGGAQLLNVPYVSFWDTASGGAGITPANPTVAEWAITPPATASAATLNALHQWDPVTLTLTGTTHVTGTSLALARFVAPTVTSATAVTIDQAATVTITGPIAASGSATIGQPYALWVQSGNTKILGNLFISLTGATHLATDITGKVIADNTLYASSAAAPIQLVAGIVSLQSSGVTPGLWILGNSTLNIDTYGRITAISPGSYYTDVAVNGSLLTERPILNFSSAFTGTDSASPARTNIDLNQPVASTYKWSVFSTGGASGSGLTANGGSIIFPGDTGNLSVGTAGGYDQTQGLANPVAAMASALTGTPAGSMVPFYAVNSTYSGGKFDAFLWYLGASGTVGLTATLEFSLWYTTNPTSSAAYVQLATRTINVAWNGSGYKGDLGTTTFTSSIPAGALLLMALRRTDTNTGVAISPVQFTATANLYK